MYTKGEIFLISKTEEAAERFADEIRNLKSIENNVREVQFVGEHDVVVCIGMPANVTHVPSSGDGFRGNIEKIQVEKRQTGPAVTDE